MGCIGRSTTSGECRLVSKDRMSDLQAILHENGLGKFAEPNWSIASENEHRCGSA